jgi:hypothetical protein
MEVKYSRLHMTIRSNFGIRAQASALERFRDTRALLCHAPGVPTDAKYSLVHRTILSKSGIPKPASACERFRDTRAGLVPALGVPMDAKSSLVHMTIRSNFGIRAQASALARSQGTRIMLCPAPGVPMDAKSCLVLGTILLSFGTRVQDVVCERFICCRRTNGRRFSNREHCQTRASRARSSARRPRLGVGSVGWFTIGQAPPSPAAPLSKPLARSQAWKRPGGTVSHLRQKA